MISIDKTLRIRIIATVAKAPHNIMLPPDLVRKAKGWLPKRGLSALLTRLLEQWVKRQENDERN